MNRCDLKEIERIKESEYARVVVKNYLRIMVEGNQRSTVQIVRNIELKIAMRNGSITIHHHIP